MPPSTVPRLFSVPPRFLCPGLPRNVIFHSQKRGIKSIQPRQRNRVDRFNNGAGLPKLQSSRPAAFERKEPMLPLRTGALLIKKGMSAIYDPATAKRIPCTVLQLDRCQVTGHKRRDKHGYWAVQVGMGTKEARNVTRSERGHFAGQGVPIKQHLAEFRVKNEEGLPAVGSNITADLFQPGQFVDVRGITRGMGFTGGMKRWGWGGQPASHGNSKTHRAMGSSGASQGSGSRVHPGKHMPGRTGAESNTVQNLKILQVDADNGIVVVSGPVSGPKHSIVSVQDAIKKPWPQVDLAMGVSRMGSTSEKLEAAVA